MSLVKEILNCFIILSVFVIVGCYGICSNPCVYGTCENDMCACVDGYVGTFCDVNGVTVINSTIYKAYICTGITRAVVYVDRGSIGQVEYNSTYQNQFPYLNDIARDPFSNTDKLTLTYYPKYNNLPLLISFIYNSVLYNVTIGYSNCIDFNSNTQVSIPYSQTLILKNNDVFIRNPFENTIFLKTDMDREYASSRCNDYQGPLGCSVLQDPVYLNVVALTYSMPPFQFQNSSRFPDSKFEFRFYESDTNATILLDSYFKLYIASAYDPGIFNLSNQYIAQDVLPTYQPMLSYVQYDSNSFNLGYRSFDLPSLSKVRQIIPGPFSTGKIYFINFLNNLAYSRPMNPKVSLNPSITINSLELNSTYQANLFQYTITKNNVSEYSVNAFFYQQKGIPFPYTIVSRSGPDTFVQSFAGLVPQFMNIYTQYQFTYSFEVSNIEPPNIVTVNQIGPIITSVNIFPIGRMKGILQIVTGSAPSEIGYIQFGDYRLASKNIVNVTANCSQIPIDYSVMDLTSPSIIINTYDRFLNPSSFTKNSIYHYNIPNDVMYFNPYNLKSISFQQNNLDLSNVGITNTVYLNYIGADPNHSPYFIPIINRGKDTMSRFFEIDTNRDRFRMEWDSTKQLFKYSFYIPPRLFPGYIDYKLYIVPHTFSVQTLYSLLGPSVLLNVTSSHPVETPPLINDIRILPNSIISITNNPIDVSIGFKLELTANGFKRGVIQISSVIDIVGFTFNLEPRIMDSGGYYNCNFTIAQYSPTQNYTVTRIELEDNSGHISTLSGGGLLLNPIFMKYYDYPILQVECLATDTISPTLTDFIIYPTNYVHQPDNLPKPFYISFTLKDNNILETRYTPIIYIESVFGERVEFPANISEIKSIDKIFYNTSIQIPIFRFGLGSSHLLVSIYGISDTGLNFVGYNGRMLADLTSNLNFIFIDNNKYGAPYISTNSFITSNGGNMNVYGYNLNLDTEYQGYIDYNDGKGFNLITLNKNLDGSLQFIGIQPTLFKFNIQVKVYVEASSNNYVIQPTVINDSPSTPVIQCQGTPLCGGPTHGTCIPNQGCLCIYPWSSIDCLSRIVNTTAPEPNKDQPDISGNYSTQLPSGQSVTYTSFISVVKLLEFDFKESIVKNISLSNWIYRDNSNSTHTLYTYTTNITVSNSNVSIQVDIYWFTKYEIIQFAGQNIEMNPSTMKYKIYISQYPFKSYLNSLQLIISSKILSSNTENSCSAKEFQDSSPDFQYMKLQIDDHSLYGRFIKRAEIDGYPIAISNTLLDNNFKQLLSTNDENTNNNYDSQSYIGINIPNFRNYALIDPDFSMLIDSRSASDSSNSKCASTIKSGLSREQLIGIIVGSVVGGILITLIFIFVIYKRYLRYNGMILSMKEKLKKINK